MISPYLTNITPDSFSGLVFAFEGIKDTIVLLNGPTGCKFYHSATSDNQILRQMEFDPLNYPELWYFGQPRVPCTYLDKKDYVYGSKEKLTEGIRYLKKNITFDLMVVVNSPGEALIGDDLKRITEAELKGFPVVTVETPGYSRHVWEGYANAGKAITEQLILHTPKKEKKPGTRKKVNLLGLSIYQKFYEGDKNEWTRMLNLCGIDVNCALFCECTPEEIMNFQDADLNLVLNPSYGLELAKYMEEKLGMPYLAPSALPVGFKATEQLMKEVCQFLHCDDSAFVTASEQARARAYVHISRVNSLTGLPKGTKFAVQGTTAECLGYTEFLIRYFGMVADSIARIDPEGDTEELQRLLKSAHMEGALEKDILDTDAELVFANGNTIAKLKALRHEFSGVETALPSLGYLDVMPKTHLGIKGALLICEEILNGLMY